MSNRYFVIGNPRLEDGGEEMLIVPASPDSIGTYNWREAKKALRAYYLNKAASLRKVTENDYFQKESN